MWRDEKDAGVWNNPQTGKISKVYRGAEYWETEPWKGADSKEEGSEDMELSIWYGKMLTIGEPWERHSRVLCITGNFWAS